MADKKKRFEKCRKSTERFDIRQTNRFEGKTSGRAKVAVNGEKKGRRNPRDGAEKLNTKPRNRSR